MNIFSGKKEKLIKSKSNGIPTSPDSTNKSPKTKRPSRRRRVSLKDKTHIKGIPKEVGAPFPPKNEVIA